MPPITKVTIPGSNYQVGRAAKIDQITFHHIVGDAPAAIARFKDPNEIVSSTYIIGKDGRIYQCVAEKDTPYTDGNFSSNSRAITIEHAGGHSSVPYTAAMYASSAKLVAWIRSRYNITRLVRHRDVSLKPTACPGTLDLNRIINAAKEQSVKIPDQTNWYNRMRKLMKQIRGRDLGREEFRKNFVGQDNWRMVEILSDNTESDRALAAQTLGQKAIAEGWEAKIANANAVQAELDASKAEIARLKDDEAQDTATGNSFIRWIGDLFRSNK